MKPLAFALTPHVSCLLEKGSNRPAIPHLHGVFLVLGFLCALSVTMPVPESFYLKHYLPFPVVSFCGEFPGVDQRATHHTWRETALLPAQDTF